MIVDGERIHSVVETAPACGVAVSCTNYAVVAGKVGVHTPAEPEDADGVYLRTLLGGIELLRSGVTTVVGVGEEPAVRAYRDLGLRALDELEAGDGDRPGGIEPGRRADLVLLTLKSRAVDSVMVGGEWRMLNGRIKGVDEAAVLAEARARGL